VNVKRNVATIGMKVKAKNPMIQGEMKRSAQPISRRASVERERRAGGGPMVRAAIEVP
jgi:hypothetical protein